jgi:hypothetical protein
VLYLILLAPLGALGLLVGMSSLERWHDRATSAVERRGQRPGP